MTDFPINMSADQVQALLAGKTRHRVVLEPQPEIEVIPDGQYVDSYCSERKTPENPRGMSRDWCLWTTDNRQGRDFAEVPYTPGDRLQVGGGLTLIIEDVRVQRLQEISEADAVAEGCRPFFDEDDAEMVPTGNGGHIPMLPLKGPVDALHKAWDKQHKRPEHQWKANPWVCALTFRVIHQNIDEVKT